MNYLAQMLRDCSKNKSTSFTELSFPIVQEIENKIRNKNANLRKKIKQRLLDRQRIIKYDDRKEDSNPTLKKDAKNQKTEKEIINYIEAYDDQKSFMQNKKSLVQLDDVYLDERQSEVTFNIYILMRKRKGIFKVEEVKRKIRNKENLKRMSFKQCDCCERVGKHKCLHTYCEGKCDKTRKHGLNPQQDLNEEQYAIQLAQQIIEQAVKQEDLSVSVVRIVQKEEEALSIPKIDITEKEEMAKDDAEDVILNERQRISENESKSDISESKKNKGSEFIQERLENIEAEEQQPRVQFNEKANDI